MIYAYRENDHWVFPVGMRSRFKGVRAWHTLTDEQRAKYGWHPFEASGAKYDPQTQVRSGLFNVRLDADGVVRADYLVEPKNQHAFESELRAERDSMIAATDWTQLPDVPEPIQAAWKPYRQALRDVPQQEGFPWDVQWPVQPGNG